MKQLNIEKLTKRNETILVLDLINFAEIGRLFNYKGAEIEFFKAQILVKGLEDFRLTVAPGLTDEQKREIVREEIANWNNHPVRKEISFL